MPKIKKKSKIVRLKDNSTLDDRHSTLVCFRNCEKVHAKHHRDYALGILEALLSFSSRDRLQRVSRHHLKGNLKGILSIDIMGRKCKYRMLVKREGNVNVIEKLCTDETHNK